jgi:hypothetical protein
MRIVIERKASTKGWVAYPYGAGRPVNPSKVGKTKTRRSTVVEASTREDVIAEYLKASGFKPANFVAATAATPEA